MDSLAITRLRQLPQPRTKYPKGTRQPLTKPLAQHFFDLLSTCNTSILQLLRDNPDLPTFKTLDTWRTRYPWFAELWKQARQYQAEFLIQSCLDLAKNTTAKTAHETRVKFDVYRFIASKFHPDVYGDKPQAQSTTVNVGVSISAERLGELRTKLDSTRSHFRPLPSTNGDATKVESRVCKENHANNHD